MKSETKKRFEKQGRERHGHELLLARVRQADINQTRRAFQPVRGPRWFERKKKFLASVERPRAMMHCSGPAVIFHGMEAN